MTKLRIATFNVHHCEGRDGRVDVERVAEAIRRTGAGFVALQELDQGMGRSGGDDQPALLSDLTGLEVVFAPTLEKDGGRYGIAVAAQGPVQASELELPRLADEEPRVVIVATWAGLCLFATHLSRRVPTREAQTRALAEAAHEADGPAVVMGDLNQGRRHLGPLTEVGLVPPPEHHKTLAARLRRVVADHILAGPGLAHRGSATVETDASDHLPLVADLEVL